MASDDLSHRFDGESVARTLEIVGERWTMLIMREAFFGVRRFGQLARNLNIPRPTLSVRLRTLVDGGLLERVPYSHDPDRYEYRLTDAGRELFSAIVILMQWGDKHLPNPRGRRSCCATTSAVTSPNRGWTAHAAGRRSPRATSLPKRDRDSESRMAH